MAWHGMQAYRNAQMPACLHSCMRVRWMDDQHPPFLGHPSQKDARWIDALLNHTTSERKPSFHTNTRRKQDGTAVTGCTSWFIREPIESWMTDVAETEARRQPHALTQARARVVHAHMHAHTCACVCARCVSACSYACPEGVPWCDGERVTGSCITRQTAQTTCV